MKTEIIVIDSKAYDQLKADVCETIRTEFTKLREDMMRSAQGEDWLTPSEVREMLNIGRTKYFALKAQGAFLFSQFGRKAKISRKSIEVFLKNNIV